MSLISNIRSGNISSPQSKTVRFAFNYDLKNIFLGFVNEKDNRLYDECVNKIRHIGQEIKDDELLQLIREARGCVSILDQNLRLFVQVVLILRWAHRSDEVVSEFQGFLIDLCSANNYFTKSVIEHLVMSFRTVDDTVDWVGGMPSDRDAKIFSNIHQTVKAIIQVVPMSKQILLAALNSCAPYIKKPPSEHAAYVCNALHVSTYEPNFRLEILKTVTHKIVSLDVNIPRTFIEGLQKPKEEEEGVFKMEDGPSSPEESLIESLDLCMKVYFGFLRSQCYDKDGNLVWDKSKALYADIIKVLETVLLPTHGSTHAQFIVFYLASFKPALAVGLLQLLWSKASSPGIAPVVRQSAIGYIASFVARASNISTTVVLDILSEMASWVHSYIRSQEAVSVVMQDTRIHGVFYSVCQAIFYIIAFRHKELVCTDKGLTQLAGLNLSKIVTSRLNPLRSCTPVVANRFASVARAYQLAYCYTIMERNSRSRLPQLYRDAGGCEVVMQIYMDTFFPFDPYILPKSSEYIKPLYREYKGDHIEETPKEQMEEDDNDNDFMETCHSIASSLRSSSLAKFSYSTSPGFLHNV